MLAVPAAAMVLEAFRIFLLDVGGSVKAAAIASFL